MTAWVELSEAEDKEVWRRFDRRFRFRPSVKKSDWPGIQVPAPFATYSVPDPWSAADITDLHEHALTAFRLALPRDSSMYALDWQHSCYRFAPHAPVESWPMPDLRRRGLGSDHKVRFEDRWTIPVLPNGDYYIFLAPDFTWGWIGHPWEQSICVFGDKLVSAVAKHRPSLFTKVLRKGADNRSGR
jgi:hypothetical protein